MIDELVELVEGGHDVGSQTVDAILGALESDQDVREVFESVVWRHRGKQIAPKTVTQKAYVDAIRRCTVTFGIGPAGTGKTYRAMALAVAALHVRQVARIILTRPAVEGGERLGFLPGDMLAKVDPYLRPLFDALFDMPRPRAGRTPSSERGTIEVAPLAFMRGRTLNDSFIILDEAQNTTPEQMQMFLTRLGWLQGRRHRRHHAGRSPASDQASGLIQVQSILRTSTGSRSSASATRTSSATSWCSGSSRPTARHAEETAPTGDGRRWCRSRSRTAAPTPSTFPARSSWRAAVLAAEGIEEGELGLAFVRPDEMRR